MWSVYAQEEGKTLSDLVVRIESDGGFGESHSRLFPGSHLDKCVHIN